MHKLPSGLSAAAHQTQWRLNFGRQMENISGLSDVPNIDQTGKVEDRLWLLISVKPPLSGPVLQPLRMLNANKTLGKLRQQLAAPSNSSP